MVVPKWNRYAQLNTVPLILPDDNVDEEPAYGPDERIPAAPYTTAPRPAHSAPALSEVFTKCLGIVSVR